MGEVETVVEIVQEKSRVRREDYQCQHWMVQLDSRIVQVEKEGSGNWDAS